MYEAKMQLTDEQLSILGGGKGEVMAKMMETVVRFGDIFGARRLIPVTHREGHLVTSFGIGLLKPLFSTSSSVPGQIFVESCEKF